MQVIKKTYCYSNEYEIAKILYTQLWIDLNAILIHLFCLIYTFLSIHFKIETFGPFILKKYTILVPIFQNGDIWFFYFGDSDSHVDGTNNGAIIVMVAAMMVVVAVAILT